MDNSKTSNEQVQDRTSDAKPRRRDFTKTIVIQNNGALVDESAWRSKVGDLKGRELSRALKKEGYQAVKIFQKEQYEDAKKQFYDKLHTSSKSDNAMLIDSAFEQAGYPKVQRVESVLRGVMPMLKGNPQPKVVATLRNIVKALGSAGVIESLQERERARTDRKTSGQKNGQGRRNNRQMAEATA